MMILDGAIVERGDKVYDVVMGWGEVKSVADQYCEVRFGPTIVVYRDGGKSINYRNKKTLFWQNPVIVVPAKDARRWDFMLTACTQLAKHILSYKGEDI